MMKKTTKYTHKINSEPSEPKAKKVKEVTIAVELEKRISAYKKKNVNMKAEIEDNEKIVEAMTSYNFSNPDNRKIIVNQRRILYSNYFKSIPAKKQDETEEQKEKRETKSKELKDIIRQFDKHFNIQSTDLTENDYKL
jgi:hypothetical protein